MDTSECQCIRIHKITIESVRDLSWTGKTIEAAVLALNQVMMRSDQIALP